MYKCYYFFYRNPSKKTIINKLIEKAAILTDIKLL